MPNSIPNAQLLPSAPFFINAMCLFSIQLSIPTRGIGTAQSTASIAAGSSFSTADKNFVLTRTFKQKTTDAYSGNT